MATEAPAKAANVVRITNHTGRALVWEMGGLKKGTFKPYKDSDERTEGVVRDGKGPAMWMIPASPISKNHEVIPPLEYMDVTAEQWRAIKALPEFSGTEILPHGPTQWSQDLPAPSKRGWLDDGTITVQRLDGAL